MAVMNRASFKKDLNEGINTHFGMEYDKLGNEWQACYEVENSHKAAEEDVLEVGFEAGQVKSEGGSVSYDEGGQGWSARYVAKTIALAFAITEEAIEDGLYGKKSVKLAKSLARAMHNTKEIYGAATFNNATSASALGGDAKALLATDHPLWGGGTFSNLMGTVDLSEAALEDTRTRIRKAVDDRSVPISLKPTKLVIPPDLFFDANRILKSSERVATSDNDANVLRMAGILPGGIHEVTRITDTDAWFVLTNCPDGLKMMNRLSMQKKMEGEFDTGNLRYKCRERYDFGWTNPRAVYGSMGG